MRFYTSVFHGTLTLRAFEVMRPTCGTKNINNVALYKREVTTILEDVGLQAYSSEVSQCGQDNKQARSPTQSSSIGE